MQAHTLGEVCNLGTVALRVSSGTILPIFIEIGSYLTDKEQKISWHIFFWDTVYIFANTQKFYWKNFDMKRRFIVKVWDWESIVVHWLCTLLAAVSIYRIAVVSATRFVKCNKCNHFFAVIPDSETKLNVKDSGNDARQQSDRRPPPPPRKVCHWVKILREVFVLRCVSEKMCKLWNGVPQNYKDRFWRHLAKILRRL